LKENEVFFVFAVGRGPKTRKFKPWKTGLNQNKNRSADGTTCITTSDFPTTTQPSKVATIKFGDASQSVERPSSSSNANPFYLPSGNEQTRQRRRQSVVHRPSATFVIVDVDAFLPSRDAVTSSRIIVSGKTR
jgi:hypothetical protein